MDELPFSWRLALKHALLALGFVVLLGSVAFALTADVVQSPERLGEGVGRFASFSAFGAMVASWAWQTGRARLAKGLITTWVVLVVATSAAVSLAMMGR